MLFTLQEKYECALEHSEKVKIVIPDWIVDSIKANTLLDESMYTPVYDPIISQSQSILTPDNQGQTTGAVVTANVEMVLDTPSSMLSPESPALLKLKKLSSENKGTVVLEPSSEKHEVKISNMISYTALVKCKS